LRTPEIVLVVPCYNEEKRLPVDRFLSFAHENRDVTFLFVNDGSTDGTVALLESLRATHSESFDFFSLSVNQGKAEAVRRGLLKALDLNPEYVGYWDADLSAPLDIIPHFCEVLRERPRVRMVLGARVRLLGSTIERPLLRHYLGRMAATAISLALELPVYDTQSGAKVFRASEEVRSLFQEPFFSRWLFDVEIIARAIRAYRQGKFGNPLEAVYELPLAEWRHTGGSKIHYQDYLYALRDLLRIRRTYLKNQQASFESSCR
jgi:dolichyl-phosphate beta-glucosyltransferase